METSNLKITEITADDLQEVMHLHEASRLSAWSLIDYASEINEKHSLCLIARNDTETMGFIVARMLISDAYAELLNIAVSDAYKGFGVGDKLLEEAGKTFKARGLRSILLEVRVNNQRAIGFYKKNEFSIIAERKGFYVDPPENAYTMRKIIK